MDKIVKPVSPKEPVVTDEAYIYTGEQNYEPPKADPWVSDSGEKK